MSICPVSYQPAVAQATLAQALDPHNLLVAWERVQANDGSAGWDGEGITQFSRHLSAEFEALASEVRQHSYQPRPLLCVAIEKTDGGSRELAIPCVRDRVLQTAVVMPLQCWAKPLKPPTVEWRLRPCAVMKATPRGFTLPRWPQFLVRGGRFSNAADNQHATR